MDVLTAEGWLCASRRHIGGAGDVLAIQPAGGKLGEVGGHAFEVHYIEALLIEVKSTAGGPYERFGPADRRDLIETAKRGGAQPWLYWWPPRGVLHRIGREDWPRDTKRPAL